MTLALSIKLSACSSHVPQPSHRNTSPLHTRQQRRVPSPVSGLSVRQPHCSHRTDLHSIKVEETRCFLEKTSRRLDAFFMADEKLVVKKWIKSAKMIHQFSSDRSFDRGNSGNKPKCLISGKSSCARFIGLIYFQLLQDKYRFKTFPQKFICIKPSTDVLTTSILNISSAAKVQVQAIVTATSETGGGCDTSTPANHNTTSQFHPSGVPDHRVPREKRLTSVHPTESERESD